MGKTGKKTKCENRKSMIWVLTGVICIFSILIYYLFFSSMTDNGKERFLYIDKDDNADSVYIKVDNLSTSVSSFVFRTLGKMSGYDKKIKAGRYSIGRQGSLLTFRNFLNGHQAAVHLTLPSLRTSEDIAKAVSSKLEFTKKDLYDALTDSATCARYGYNPNTIMCMFIPNTYDVYWNCSVDEFLSRIKRECDKFWTPDRIAKAKSDSLSPIQVSTIASIVAEETNNKEEKPIIAGVYINRLRINMALQSCPTVKFAMGRFDLKRLYTNMLSYDNPYNTYKYKGLPPGPIRNPNIDDIDAVLNHVRHNYLYMCAKADFSGTHEFAETYEEHKANSERYDKELNKRGIK